ncbi:ran-specific GTPase-activating protein [Orussus abietinus]|uniref:ran-specific GTPase-activating protein n=1 Tax=Orussus abietinus TaxID=222816 RepID=UPI0006264662|nr:ran-specific GTPase-activating protein [Orussus abietinus]
MPNNALNGNRVVDVNVEGGRNNENEDDTPEDEFHFDPIISLPLIDVSSNEEDEEEMIKLRAKLYRYDSSSDPPEWKERGTGEIKLLKHKTKNKVRVVMRRDKTLKICANHFITPWMELKPNCGSDRAWVWSALADFADEELKSELLAIRFTNAENAALWKEAFEKAKQIVGTECEIYVGKCHTEGIKTDSDTDSSSDVSYSVSSENEEQDKSSKQTTPVHEEHFKKLENKDKTETNIEENVTEKLKELNVMESQNK